MSARHLEASALAAAGRGWPVFPLRPCSKLPALRGWERRASADPEQVRVWWAEAPLANIGMACGPAGLVVVDLDAPTHAWRTGDRSTGRLRSRELLEVLAAEAGEAIPDTYTVETPTGQHLYFTAPRSAGLRNTVGVIGRHIDTRAAGGYVVVAGSVLRSGGQTRRYQVLRDRPPAPVPPWILAALEPWTPAGDAGAGTDAPARQERTHLGSARVRAYVSAAVAAESRAVARARTGTRNDTLFRSAASLGELIGSGMLEEAAATGALLDAATRHVGIEGFTAREARQAISNGLRRGRRHPRQLRR